MHFSFLEQFVYIVTTLEPSSSLFKNCLHHRAKLSLPPQQGRTGISLQQSLYKLQDS